MRVLALLVCMAGSGLTDNSTLARNSSKTFLFF